ncbi:MAG: hypothetical protein ABSB89_03585 [Candidatus Bathyarchaeia archaeon]
MDKFPECFERFERVVDVDRIRNLPHLKLAFSSWAGRKWLDTYGQNEALRVEARKLGIPVFVERRTTAPRESRVAVTWRQEVVTVKGSSQDRYRDLKTGRFIRKP